MKKILVSACLLGCECRYDGKSKPCEKVLALAEKKDTVLIPVCPEQMGGLSTPRTPSERQRTKKGTLRSISKPGAVLMKDGSDASSYYKKGAEMALEIAKLCKVDYAILKSGSPSCGKDIIYDGSFSGKKAEGNGVTTEILLKEGFKVLSEEEL
ncbi:MAG: DUF523 domain-containing protein [Firmicutes bacterium]|nr:DUF523 domain-containing protein [Bacillota bacterium]